MRIHYNLEVSVFLRNRGAIYERLRRRIESLLKAPIPDDARAILEHPGIYEIFDSGYWIVYEVDKSDPGETVIRVVVIEPN
jgi:hypothetical protein